MRVVVSATPRKNNRSRRSKGQLLATSVNDDGIGVVQPVAPKSNISSILELVQHAQADILAFKHRLQVAYSLCQFHMTLGRARVHEGSRITVGQVLGDASHFAVF